MMRPANRIPIPKIPTAWLDEDGEHFWFLHECSDVAKDWSEKGHPLDPDSAAFFQNGRNARMLPLGPEGWTVTSKDPLTISPSIACGSCTTHGFVRDGQWISV